MRKLLVGLFLGLCLYGTSRADTIVEKIVESNTSAANQQFNLFSQENEDMWSNSAIFFRDHSHTFSINLSGGTGLVNIINIFMSLNEIFEAPKYPKNINLEGIVGYGSPYEGVYLTLEYQYSLPKWKQSETIYTTDWFGKRYAWPTFKGRALSVEVDLADFYAKQYTIYGTDSATINHQVCYYLPVLIEYNWIDGIEGEPVNFIFKRYLGLGFSVCSYKFKDADIQYGFTPVLNAGIKGGYQIGNLYINILSLEARYFPFAFSYPGLPFYLVGTMGVGAIW